MKANIEIFYPGACISVNHYWLRKKGGGFYTNRDAKDWMEGFGWLLLAYSVQTFKAPLKVTVSGRFKDKGNQPDLDNLAKCILDEIEEVTGINDRDMRFHSGEVTYGEPTLFIEIEEG